MASPDPAAQHRPDQAPAAAGQGEEETAPGSEEAAKEGAGRGEYDDETEDGECAFCRDAFFALVDCVLEEEPPSHGGGAPEERCAQAIADLTECMRAHADYYAPLLQADNTVCELPAASTRCSSADEDSNKEE